MTNRLTSDSNQGYQLCAYNIMDDEVHASYCEAETPEHALAHCIQFQFNAPEYQNHYVENIATGVITDSLPALEF